MIISTLLQGLEMIQNHLQSQANIDIFSYVQSHLRSRRCCCQWRHKEKYSIHICTVQSLLSASKRLSNLKTIYLIWGFDIQDGSQLHLGFGILSFVVTHTVPCSKCSTFDRYLESSLVTYKIIGLFSINFGWLATHSGT